MDFLNIAKTIGKAAIGFLPFGGTAVTALEGIAHIADIVGDEKGKKIKNGLLQISEGLKDVGNAPMSPEIQAKLVEGKQKFEIKMRELAIKDKSLTYEDQAGGREIIKTALTSKDKFVRQARSKMMLALGRSAICITLSVPFVFLIAKSWLKLDETSLKLLIDVLQWPVELLWGSFTIAFTGYTVAKAKEKGVKKFIGISGLMK